MLRRAASPFLHPAVQPAIGKQFWIVLAGSNPARFHSTAEAQTGADALADAAGPVPVCDAFPCRTQSNPNPANAARSKLFSADGQILFPTRGVFEAMIPAFGFFAARNQQRRSQTAASLADNLPAWFATVRI